MWVATAPALATIEEIGVEAIHAHDVGLAKADVERTLDVLAG